MVRMIIRFERGLRREAVLLDGDSHRMRIAIDSRDDATELIWFGDGWFAETGEAVHIDALMTVSDRDASRFGASIRPMALAAGRGLRCD